MDENWKPIFCTPTFLDLAKLPAKEEPVIIYRNCAWVKGSNIVFSSTIWHQVLLSFTFGFANANTIRQYNEFSSLMTGDMVLITLNVKTQN